jgi:hypothetical protein
MFLKEIKNKIMGNYRVECSVSFRRVDKVTNIRCHEDGVLDWRGTNIDGGDSVVVEFTDPNGYVVATSDSEDKYPQIGLDFLWPYLQSGHHRKTPFGDISSSFDFNKRIKSVYVTFKEEYPLNIDNVKLHKNGDVIVSPCDEKEFTEKDVVMMLSYAVAHDKVTSKEMKDKVSEILNWFKSN